MSRQHTVSLVTAIPDCQEVTLAQAVGLVVAAVPLNVCGGFLNHGDAQNDCQRKER